MTTTEIQQACGLMLCEQRYLWVGQNVTHFFRKCECDVIGLSRAGYLVEVEVKVSRPDFFADFKKSRWKPMEKIVKAGRLDRSSRLLNVTRFPNRHYYAAPEGLIDVSELPPWSGLIAMDHRGTPVVVRKAPLLHKGKVNAKKTLEYAARRSMRLEFGYRGRKRG